MNSLRNPFVFVLVCVLCFNVGDLRADCMCFKSKMFPYSPGYWMYYAEHDAANCVHVSTQSVVGADTINTPENCTGNCAGCEALGAADKFIKASDVPHGHVHFPSLPEYTSLWTASQISEFIRTNTPYAHPSADQTRVELFLKGIDFVSPNHPHAPPVVKLTRKNGNNNEVFYAVLWKVHTVNDDTYGYLGVEINYPGNAVANGAWTPINDGIHRATTQAIDDDHPNAMKTVEVKGLLDVKIPVSVGFTRYYVRLQDTAVNNDPHAFP